MAADKVTVSRRKDRTYRIEAAGPPPDIGLSNVWLQKRDEKVGNSSDTCHIDALWDFSGRSIPGQYRWSASIDLDLPPSVKSISVNGTDGQSVVASIEGAPDFGASVTPDMVQGGKRDGRGAPK